MLLRVIPLIMRWHITCPEKYIRFQIINLISQFKEHSRWYVTSGKTTVFTCLLGNVRWETISFSTTHCPIAFCRGTFGIFKIQMKISKLNHSNIFSRLWISSDLIVEILNIIIWLDFCRFISHQTVNVVSRVQLCVVISGTSFDLILARILWLQKERWKRFCNWIYRTVDEASTRLKWHNSEYKTQICDCRLEDVLENFSSSKAL